MKIILKLFITGLTLVFHTGLIADIRIEITEGVEGAIPMSVVEFDTAGLPVQIKTDIAQIVSEDLNRSGVFKVLNSAQYVTQPHYSKDVNYSEWRKLNQEYLVVGRILAGQPGRLNVQFQLLDVLKQKQLVGYSFPVTLRNLRTTAHEISDLIYETITGTPGAFNTRIAYISARNGSARKYVLQVADTDGFNPQTVLESDEPLMSPAWSPDGRELAIVLSRDNSPDIYTINVETKKLKRLTTHRAIDTEPVWSPDGQSIIFTSDRSGSPQLYEVSIAGGSPKRITFEGRYNAAADISQDGKNLVMVYGEGGRYQIAQLDKEKGYLSLLTDNTLDESPSFSPNGRMVLYASTQGNSGVLYMVSLDGQSKHKLSDQSGDIREPVWGPFKERNRSNQ